MSERLGGVDVALWWAEPAQGDREEAERWLAPEELERLARFKSEPAAREYACGHGLVRRVLGSLAPIAPRDWRFVEGAHGRP
ncbi:MAG: 4-phosphopantetheinyl transferase, partial [Planctomycetota bacterium]